MPIKNNQNIITEYRELKEDLKNKQEEIFVKRENIEVKKRDISAKQLIAAEEEKRKETLLAETKNKESLYQKNFNDLAKKAMEFEA